jgi:nitric oxide reductase NorD protein
MEWDQVLFKKTWNILAALKPKADQKSGVSLESIHTRLTLLARMLCGEVVEILRAEQEGGVSGKLLFLPERFALGKTPEQNSLFYLYRVAYLSIQMELGYNWPDMTAKSLNLSRQKAYQCSPHILSQLYLRYPAMKETFQTLLKDLAEVAKTETEQALAWGRWMGPDTVSGSIQAQTPEERARQQESEMTSRQAPAREQVEIESMDKSAMQAYTLQHQFEKVETIEEFQGTWRDADGSDELEAHADALNEVDLRKLTRSDDTAHSVLQAEFISNISVPDVADQPLTGRCISYDEWDTRKRQYRRDWCKVYIKQQNQQDPAYLKKTLENHRRVLQNMRRRFSMQFNSWQSVNRQTQGEEPDLEALVENFADLHAGRTPSEKIYLSKRKKRREVSLILLMDLSLSSDGYTGGYRVLDVEKQSVILFSQLLSEWGDRFQIDGFASHTRNQCEYLTLKSFKESWAQTANRIGAVEPRGYTRIGPALRHATSLLENERSRSRWIVLLSDGKPNDYDRYEGQYGLADVRQAIHEARTKNVQVYGLAIESLARNYLPLMLGQGGYRILPQPALLPQALTDFYGRLIRN